MKFPCEIVVWKLLPAIRAKLAGELSKEGLSQRDIANILGITESAVSQYVSGKRATEFKIDPALDLLFKEAAKKLKESKSPITVLEECCKICRKIKSGKFMCEVHRANTDLPLSCDICRGDE